MKLAILSFSGSCGKTTLSGQLFKPRLKDALVYSIESFNSGLENDGVEAEKIAASKFKDIFTNILIAENVVVDIGASNVSTFLKLMSQYKSSHSEFDYFIIPVTKEKKNQIDTIGVIDTLRGIGIDAKRILVVLNKVDIDEIENIDSDFQLIMNMNESEKSFKLVKNSVIHFNDIYDALKEIGLSIETILNDQTNYRELLKSTSDSEKKIEYANMIGYKNLAATASENLDSVFKAMFGAKAHG